MMTNAGTKRIFISDIHMGDERSQAGPNPYGWFHDNISHLAKFLTKQVNAPEVSEVVILGDLFDEWVIPTNQDPLTSFQDIYNNHNNDPVLDPLRQLAAEGILFYVPGNHDMTLSTTNPAGNQQFLENTFPGIHYLADGVYRRGRLVAEHGHRYCLFNAADTWTNLPSLLPLGYFISRMVAYKVSKTGERQDYVDILRKFIKQTKDRPNFVKELYRAVAMYAGLKDTDPIDMAGIDGFLKVTVGDIGSLYEKLIEKWKENRRDIKWGVALLNDGPSYLYPAATHISSGTDHNIVIFGHTHHWDMLPLPFRGAAPQVEDIHLDLPCRAIYANCGTWIDSTPSFPHPCTYVETQEDAAAGRHYVRVLSYPKKTVHLEWFVRL
jgi:UDP-2,3-diacylglucosamine pyrophosphatase LpxH